MARGEDGRYYMFSTGNGISVMSSDDLVQWRREAPVFDAPLEWAMDSVEGFRHHVWAPDVCRHDGKWHLYYSCSTFGKNGSAIGHAVSAALDPSSPGYGWHDMGAVIVSHRNIDNWNAIDPNLAIDSDGNPWLAFGSFWDGIQLVRLEADLHTPAGAPVTIARRVEPDAVGLTEGDSLAPEAGGNAIEAPFIYRRGGYYYLFVSHDYCCRGENSTYKTVYGRADNIEGPYIDREGRRMDAGGGTFLYGPDDTNYGTGHCAVYDNDGDVVFMSHSYDKEAGGRALLFMRRLAFTGDGWIVPVD